MIWLAFLYFVIGAIYGIYMYWGIRNKISLMAAFSLMITWPISILTIIFGLLFEIMRRFNKFIIWLFSRPVLYLVIILGLILYAILSNYEPVKAGVITGEKHLGGFSYLMECANNKEAPDESYSIMMRNLIAKHRYIYELNDEEKEILYRIVEAEATDGTIEQKENVASCVLARMGSDDFPNTITKVVFEKYKDTWQFSPLGDGRYYTVKIQDDTIEAVNNVLKNGKTHDCLWFCSDKSYKKKNSYHRLHHEWSFFDGIHHYFY